MSVVYDRLNGLPAGRSSRPVFAWYGDMDIASHFWRMTQHLDMRVTVLLHAPLDPATFPDRKSLSQAVWQTVADGASMLRQNRPARAAVGLTQLRGFPACARNRGKSVGNDCFFPCVDSTLWIFCVMCRRHPSFPR